MNNLTLNNFLTQRKNVKPLVVPNPTNHAYSPLITKVAHILIVLILNILNIGALPKLMPMEVMQMEIGVTVAMNVSQVIWTLHIVTCYIEQIMADIIYPQFYILN